MNDALKLTVVTIGRDTIADLRVTRESVAAQTYPHLQHLLFDGASTDGSADLVAEWAHGHSNVQATSQSDTGIYDAMNQALDLIDDGYVLFLHAGDTFVHAGVLDRAMREIASAPTTPDLAIGWSRFVNTQGPMPFVVGAATPNAVTSAHESTIFSMKFHEHERYDTSLMLAADYAFFRDLALRPDLKVLRLNFTISHFVFGGRSNNPEYDRARFKERALINAQFGEPITRATRLRAGARTAVRKVAYRMLGADRANEAFLRLACRRGNSGARHVAVDQVDVVSRSAG